MTTTITARVHWLRVLAAVGCCLAGTLTGAVAHAEAATGQSSAATAPGLNGGFVVSAGPEADIWAARPDGTAPRQLTTGSSIDRCPAVSPSGTLVGFCRGNETGYELWLVNGNGADARQLTQFPANTAALQPTFSSSRPLVAFSYVRDWSAVGAAPGVTYDIHSIRSDGSHASRLTRSGAWHDFRPSFSPDGRSLLWTRTGATRRNDGQAQLWTMRANGKDKRLLSADINRNQGADWSPDGRLVVYRSGSDLNVIRTDGTLVRKLPDRGKDPLWAPNGRWIAYRTVTHIELVSRDGRTTRSVPRFWGRGRLASFVWQPLPQ